MRLSNAGILRSMSRIVVLFIVALLISVGEALAAFKHWKSACRGTKLFPITTTSTFPSTTTSFETDTTVLNGAVSSNNNKNDNFNTTTSGKRNKVDKDISEHGDYLSYRVIGFFPFVGSPLRKFTFEWIFKDTHQAIIVETLNGKEKVLLDFMTKGGQSHPVWWDERVKWNVFLGGSIRGEVRQRFLGKKEKIKSKKENFVFENDIMSKTKNNYGRSASTTISDSMTSPRLLQLLEASRSYDCNMNLYCNNCRMFCARMEREVERLNAEEQKKEGITAASNLFVNESSDAAYISKLIPNDVVADIRCSSRIFGAGLLPALYPMAVLLSCYEGLHGI